MTKSWDNVLLVVALACGGCADDVDHGPIGTVTVRVFDGTPVAGTEILFHDPDGELLATASTDVAGVATHDVPDGSMVTRADSWAADGQEGVILETITGVMRGEEILFGRRAAEADLDPTPIATVHVELPGDAAGGGLYAAFIPCRDEYGYSTIEQPTPIDVPLRAACLNDDGTTFDVFAVAWPAEPTLDGMPAAYSFLLDVPADRDAVALPAWTSEPATLPLPMVGEPGANIGGEYTLLRGDGSVSGLISVEADGLWFDDDGRATAVLNYMDGYAADGVDVHVSSNVDGEPYHASAADVTERRNHTPFPDTMEPVDLTPSRYPIASDLALEDPSDPTRPIFVWSPPDDVADLDEVSLHFWNSTPDGSREVGWTLHAPPDVTRIEVPALPDELAPRDQTVGFGASYTAADHIDGYDEARANVEARWDLPAGSRTRSASAWQSLD